MRYIVLAGVTISVILAISAPRAVAQEEELLRRAFAGFLKSAEELRIDAVPDLYEGGYARITAVGRRVTLSDGLKVDEATVRLTGVSLDPQSLRAGTLKVLDFRDSAMQVRVLLRSLQDFLNVANSIADIRLWAEDNYLNATGTVMFRNQPTRVRMKGFFAVSGTTEIYFYLELLTANNIPMPGSVVRDIERQINPVLHQRDWPVTFKLRSVRLDNQALTVSTQGDVSCPGCGGGEPQQYAP